MSAASFVRLPNGIARATTEHMPFAGHRTMATVFAQQDAARRRTIVKERKAKEYGFDPASLSEKPECGR